MKKLFLSFILIASLGAQSMHHEMNHDSHQDAKSIVQQVYETFASGDMEAWAAVQAGKANPYLKLYNKSWPVVASSLVKKLQILCY